MSGAIAPPAGGGRQKWRRPSVFPVNRRVGKKEIERAVLSDGTVQVEKR